MHWLLQWGGACDGGWVLDLGRPEVLVGPGLGVPSEGSG